MKVFYDKDADLSLIKGKQVTIVGYGSQGHAHALNLKESGVKITVGLRKGGASWSKAENAGLQVKEVAEAVKGADVVMMLLPDEQIAEVYAKEVHANIMKARRLLSHTALTHYGQVIRACGSGRHHGSRRRLCRATRCALIRKVVVPHLIAVAQNKSGAARDIALSYAAANGG